MNHTTTTDTPIAAKHGNNGKLVDVNNREAENLDEITQVLAEIDRTQLTARVNRIRLAVIGRVRKRFCSVFPLM